MVEVGEIEDQPVEYDTYKKQFKVTICEKVFVSPSFQGLVKKINDFRKIEWEKALIVPYGVSYMLGFREELEAGFCFGCWWRS